MSPTVTGVMLASASALALHEVAHLLAAYRRNARLVPKQWFAGSVLALVLLPRFFKLLILLRERAPHLV